MTRLTIVVLCVLCSSASVPAQQGDDPLAAARLLIRQQENREAIRELQSLAAKQPAIKGLHHELGVAYYREAEYLKAAEYLEAAVGENPQDRDAVQLLGLSYYASGRPF